MFSSSIHSFLDFVHHLFLSNNISSHHVICDANYSIYTRDCTIMKYPRSYYWVLWLKWKRTFFKKNQINKSNHWKELSSTNVEGIKKYTLMCSIFIPCPIPRTCHFSEAHPAFVDCVPLFFLTTSQAHITFFLLKIDFKFYRFCFLMMTNTTSWCAT